MKWMSMREFLRGGYKDLDDITVVANHGRPVFTVTPFNGGWENDPAQSAPSKPDITRPIFRPRHDK